MNLIKLVNTLYNKIYKPIEGQPVFASKPIQVREDNLLEFDKWVSEFNVSYQYRRDEAIDLQQSLPFMIKYNKNTTFPQFMRKN